MAKSKVYVDIMKYSTKKEYKGKVGVSDYEVKIDIDTSKLAKKADKTQYNLDTGIMTSMERFMPMLSGLFIQVTKRMSAALAGTGVVVAAAPPNGRLLYNGLNMVDEETGSPWARKGARKVLVSEYQGKTDAKIELEYSKAAHPDAQAKWFEVAKRYDLKDWVNIVERGMNNG